MLLSTVRVYIDEDLESFIFDNDFSLMGGHINLEICDFLTFIVKSIALQFMSTIDDVR